MRRSRKEHANLRRAASWSAPKSTDALNFGPKAAQNLQNSIQGSVVLPTDPDYAQARQDLLNTYQSYPQLVAYCEVARDVQKCIAFAKKHGLYPVCRAGGHSTAGFSVNDDMVIDVSRMGYVVIDAEAKRATVGAGTDFAMFNAVLDTYRLHVPGGGCPSVNVAGYMQGGGYGFTSLLYGMNCDHVVEAVMVLANGKIVTVNERQHADLYWAVRGGTGNNFGVLVQITYRLHDLYRLWGFGLRWPLKSAAELERGAEVLATWQAHFTGEAAKPGLGHQMLILYVQGEPWLMVRGMYDGSAAECRGVLEPLFDLMADQKKQCDVWRGGTYEALNGYLLAYPTDLPDVAMTTRTLVDSRFVAKQLEHADWAQVLAYFARSPAMGNFIAMEPMGGAINAIAPDANAFCHRQAMINVFTWVFWMTEGEKPDAERYAAEFDRVLAPLSNGHSNQNYPNRNNKDYRWRYWGDNFKRLLQIKQRHDPNNLFRFPQMISPGTSYDSAQ